MPDRTDLRPGPATRRVTTAQVQPRTLVEVRGDILDAAGTTRPVAFGRRSVVLPGERNQELALVVLGSVEPLVLEVRGTVQPDRRIWVQVALSLGEHRTDAESTVVGDRPAVPFEVELHDGERLLGRASGTITAAAEGDR